MKIRPRNIPKFLTGNKLWYQGILDYDPTKYVSAYDTSRLVNGDMKDTNLTPWKSNISGYDLGRYLPTTGYGAYGKDGPHFNYTKGVEGQDYYQQFGRDLLDANGNFTETGLAWAKAVDALLPPGSNASFFDSNNNLRNNWTVGHNDAHNRNRLRNYTKLSDYVNDIRYDQILGARHNVFLRKGKRYFYTDNEGNRHWVDPEEAKNYTISKDPVELGWEGTTYWDDYELTGPESPTDDGSTDVGTGHKDKYGFDWNKLKDAASKLLNNPNLYANGRLLGNLVNNERIYNEALQGIKPALRQTYNTYRLVVGDEASKLAYYRRAAAGQTKAALPFTSDADRQTAYMQEARRVGDELRALGDLIDNQEIRRTSDESNLHQWANTLRATEVANANIASIILANALRHNLLAQKHAAQWSSIDNHLKGIEYRKRQQLAEKEALDDQIYALTRASEIESDPNLLNLLEQLEAASKKPENLRDYGGQKLIDWDSKEIKDLVNQINQRKRLLLIETYQERYNRKYNNNLNFLKSGSKITYKKKDDLLYKSARDVVEHFRKISKMASDSYNRKTPKIEKLAPHPKGSTRKYLLGGLAPFTVYTPIALGGETSTTSTTSQTGTSGSSSKKDKNETLDMVKELFKTMQGKGLPSDVNSLYVLMLNFLGKAKAFGEDVSTDDIASMYLSLMHQVNNIEYLKSAHDASEKTLIQNGGENEFAVDFRGYLVCLSEEGDIKYAKSIADAAEKKLNPLTNHLLSQMRAIDPKLAARTDLDGVIANGVGILKIAEFLKSLLPNLGSTQTTIPGYTKKGTNDVINGLNLLLEAPEGVYEYTKHSKELNEQVKMAISYLKGILPQNMRSIIKARADYSRLTGLPGANEDLLITSLVASGYNSETTYTLEGVTGLAATKKDGNGSGTSEELKLDAATALITGKGYSTNIELNTGSSYAVNVKARYSEFLKHSGENMGAGITMQEASTSTLKGVLDWNKATLGGSTLNPTAYNYIVLNNGEVVGVDLPTKSENKNIPDFEMLKKLELLDDQLLIEGIEDSPLNWLKVNEICSKLLLPPKYDNLGKLNRLSWNRFAAFLVTTTEKALNDKKVILDMLGIADEQSREFYESIIQDKTKNDKYSLDSGWPIFGGKEELYLGTVFVPIKNNLVAGAISSGLKISITDATDLELRQRGYDLLKISTYKKNELVL